ncbi:MAG: GNAT family N-acetyltransferase [Bacilli bacterium]|nr:GNAT family N-acetyltransferase [Bacilli bacterium]
MIEKLKFITIRTEPEIIEKAATWFSSKWNVPKEAYLECMNNYLNNKTNLGWFLCLDADRIVGGLGVIENDFHERKDLTPNICAVYVEEEYRNKGIAGRLLNLAVEDLKMNGISTVYLITDHIGFYERYGFTFLTMTKCDDGTISRIYIYK